MPKQLNEAARRNELAAQEHQSLTQATASSESECRRARTILLAEQPRLPDAAAIREAQQAVQSCEDDLQAVLEKL